MTLGQRIVVLHEGRVQQIDAPLGLYNQPANRFVAGFIGSPAMNFVTGRVTRADGLRLVGAENGVALRLPDWCADELASRLDGEVVVGFRPESVYGARGRPADAELAPLALTLDVAEPLGNEIFVHTHAGDTRITARVSPQPLPGPGEPIALALDLGRLHFFDAATGEVIAAAPVAAA
jgi:multiple sugar transport system ATP-binding protein